MKNKIPKIKVTMDEYNMYDTPTESEHGGVSIYINKKLLIV